MGTGLTRLIRIYLHSITSSIIASNTIRKIVQENRRRAQKVRSHQYQVDQEAQVPEPEYFHERASFQRKDETFRFNGRNI